MKPYKINKFNVYNINAKDYDFTFDNIFNKPNLNINKYIDLFSRKNDTFAQEYQVNYSNKIYWSGGGHSDYTNNSVETSYKNLELYKWYGIDLGSETEKGK